MATVASLVRPRQRIAPARRSTRPRKISQRELANLLSARCGATALAIVAETIPAMRKTGNPYHGRTVKVSRVNGMIGWQYENAVNNQRAREGVAAYFEALPRAWGRRLPNSPLVEHNGTLYLELKVERSIEHAYFVDGKPVDAAVIEPFLPERGESSRQQVERAVVLRDYKLANIKQVYLAGEVYIVV